MADLSGLDLRVLLRYRLLVAAGYMDDDLSSELVSPERPPPHRIALDADLCIGCHACRPVCPASVIRIWDDLARIVDPTACLTCHDAPCVSSCPTGALADTSGGGL
jgi:ferredoxin